MNYEEGDHNKVRFILLLLSLACSTAWAGQVDSRFDGIWSGTETMSGLLARSQFGGGKLEPAHVPAVLGISGSGSNFVVVKGLTRGRYNVSAKSKGDTLVYALHDFPGKGAHGPAYGRTDGKLVLSSDGNTLKETATAILPGQGRPIYFIVSGVFHRERLRSAGLDKRPAASR